MKKKLFFAFFLAILFSSCKQLIDGVNFPVFEKQVVAATVTTNRTICTPANIKATQGKKDRITISWDAVENAKSYIIYHSQSPNDEFVKLAEDIEETSYTDNLKSVGKTVYYRIQSQKKDGLLSELSEIVYGTTLAVPIITDGEFDTNSTTIYWYMENAYNIQTKKDNYQSNLRFTVLCEKKDSDWSKEIVLENGSQNKCTFSNLDSASTYFYCVTATLKDDPDSVEVSEQVDETTLHSYIPLAPEFFASEGISSSEITLEITLPQKTHANVFVNGSSSKTDKEYPVCFKIYRKLAEGSEFSEIVSALYYNAKTEAPDPSFYKENPYEQGQKIVWIDDDKSLKRGEKYEYKIYSYLDTNYSKVIDTNYDKVIGEKTGSTAIGWVCAAPVFSASEEFQKTQNGLEYDSVKIDFKVSWNDLGKADEYAFAIKEICTSFSDASKVSEKWLSEEKATLFDVEKVSSLSVQIPKIDPSNVGYYSYVLYLVPLQADGSQIESAETGEKFALDSIKATNTIAVSRDIERPTALITSITSGYKDKIIVAFDVKTDEGKGIYYTIEKFSYEENGETVKESAVIQKDAVGTSGIYEDTQVEGGAQYGYILYAHGKTFAESSFLAKGTTLGTPTLAFDNAKLAYDSVSLNFKSVPAANEYELLLGEKGGFGGGKTLKFNSKGNVLGSVPEEENAVVQLSLDGNFLISIKNPEGFDDANIAGKTAAFTLKAKSQIQKTEFSQDGEIKNQTSLSENAESEGQTNARVLGPANVEANVSGFEKANEESFELFWKDVEGAAGYVIRRVRYEDGAASILDEEKGCNVYYYDAESEKLFADGESVSEERAQITKTKEGFTLCENYFEAETENPTSYQLNQAKIAWGLPYKYLVLPVLKNGGEDFEFDAGFAFNKNSKVCYKNATPTNCAATFGYALEVVAEKAASCTEQKVTWTLPYYGNELTPYLLVLQEDLENQDEAENWKKIDANTNPRDKEASYNVSDAEKNKVFFYAVKYVKQSSAKKYSLPPSYVKKLEQSMEDASLYDGEETEPKNKGYLFALGSDILKAEHPSQSGKEYAEKVTWNHGEENIYDWENKKIGPSKIEIQILNKNFSEQNENGGWQTILELDPKNFTKNAEPKNGDDAADIKCECENGQNYAEFSPKSISDEKSHPTTGLLKVLRDYKHYYRIKASRKSGEDEVTALAGSDQDGKNPSVFAYREITDEELVKCVTLIIADAVMQASIPDENSKTCNGAEGAFTVKNESQKFTWGTDGGNYIHKFTSGVPYDTAAEFVSPFEISIANVTTKNAVTYNDWARSDATTIKVVGNTIDSRLNSCKDVYVSLALGAKIKTVVIIGTHTGSEEDYRIIKIYCGRDENTLKQGTPLIDIQKSSKDNDFDKWFPYPIGTTMKNSVTKYDANYYEYKSPWWD